MTELKSNPGRFSLSGMTAIVTGSASGIGAAISQAFIEEGAFVIAADYSYSNDNLRDDVLNTKRSKLVHLDVCESQSVNDAVTKAIEMCGSIDICVNCAGIGGRSPAVDYTDEVWDKVINTNLTGMFRMCRSVGRKMIEQGHGSIINIASIGGLVGFAGSVGYQASKGGVVQLTKSLAVEWAPHQVRVNAIAPGHIATDLVRKQWVIEPQMKQFFESRTPMGHLGETSDIVGGAIFLAGNSSRMVTGQVLAIDGGFTAQ
jgi:NAD(P)-dependent dehydrogenase (short-subunit alcohol dehydrogenase family)